MGNYRLGVAFEGLGSDTSKSEGICWYFGRQLTTSQKAASDYEWVGGAGTGQGLVRIPVSVDSTVEPYEAALRTSAFSFELHLDDVCATTWLHQTVQTTVALSQVLTSGATDVYLTDSSLGGEVVYVDDEAILLGSYSGGRYQSCTRGYWGTTATGHYDDTRVYTGNPYHVRRAVRLILYDASDGTETVIWRGMVDDFSTDPDGVRLEVYTTEVFTLLQDAMINRGSPDLGGYVRATLHQRATGPAISGVLDYAQAPLDVYKRVNKVGDSSHKLALQIEDALFFGDFNDAFQRVILSDDHTAYAVPRLGSGAELDLDDVPRDVEGAAHEVFAVVRDLDEDGDGESRHASQSDYYSSTRDLTYPFHPLAICMALLVSTRATSTSDYDVLDWVWGAGLPTGWFDTTAIDALITSTRHLKIDRLILGWDGEPVRVWSVVRQLCREWGFAPGRTASGQLTFFEVRPADVEEIDGAATVTALPYLIQWLPARAETVDVFSGRIGPLPWSDGQPYTAQAQEYTTGEPIDSARAAIFSQARESTLDLTTRSATGEVVQDLLNRIVGRHFAVPRIKVRVVAGSYGHGDYVWLGNLGLQDPWLVDASGARVSSISTDYSFVGQVVGVRELIEEQAEELELMLMNFRSSSFPRLRAPSAIVASVASNTYTCESAQFTDGDDCAEFTVGDVLEVWTKYGTRRSGTSGSPDTVAITSISTNSVTVSPAFSTAPQAGDVLRLAHLDDGDGFPEDGNPNKFSLLAYTYLADSSETVSPSDLAGHLYGAGQ